MKALAYHPIFLLVLVSASITSINQVQSQDSFSQAAKLPQEGQATTATEFKVELELSKGDSNVYWRTDDCELRFESEQLRVIGRKGTVQTSSRFGDFDLTLELLDESNPGVQASLGICPLLTEPDATSKPSLQIPLGPPKNGFGNSSWADEWSAYKNGDWNRIRILAMDDNVTMWVNGTKSWTRELIERESGFISIELNHSAVAELKFRNVILTELGFESLMNRDGWSEIKADDSQQPSTWVWQDDQIVCTGQPGGWLRWNELKADFNLKLNYQLQPEGNSGVYLRVPSDGNHHGRGSGIEVQILDDQADKYSALKPFQYTGSLYAIHASKRGSSLAPEEWNSLEIDCLAHRYQVILNGQLILEVNESAVDALSVRRLEGYIGLQNHNEIVRFRNVRLGPSQQSHHE